MFLVVISDFLFSEFCFFAYSSDMNGIFLLEETVPLCVFPSLLIISLFITLKKICCNFKKRRCILGENMPLFWWREGVVFPFYCFLRIMRCIFLRAHAPARAINIIVHVFLLLLRMTKNMPRNIPVFQCLTKKLSGKVKKKSCKSWSLRKSA